MAVKFIKETDYIRPDETMGEVFSTLDKLQ